MILKLMVNFAITTHPIPIPTQRMTNFNFKMFWIHVIVPPPPLRTFKNDCNKLTVNNYLINDHLYLIILNDWCKIRIDFWFWSQTAKIRCPINYRYSPALDFCYIEISTSADFQTAKSHCKSIGARLAVLPTMEHINYIKSGTYFKITSVFHVILF